LRAQNKNGPLRNNNTGYRDFVFSTPRGGPLNLYAGLNKEEKSVNMMKAFFESNTCAIWVFTGG